MEDRRKLIESGNGVLGIELGSTRIKAVLVDENHTPIASGSHQWENRLENGIWTYSLEDIWSGVQACYQDLSGNVKRQYGAEIKSLAAIGVSAMMHGYMAFDQEDNLLTPFRTWRNTITGKATKELSNLFQFNIPERWSIAHLDQAVLNQEEHVPKITFLTTLAGYIHWKLTGRKVLGVGDASGMFPIDSATGKYHQRMADKFDGLSVTRGCPWKLREILPEILTAGEEAGRLTKEGAKLLDVSGILEEGIPFCPPEGDAGTGMAATNSVAKRTGNVSAGTSVFAMVVLEKELSRLYREIDMVTTPDGSLVAMVHANNCTSDLNAWVGIFREFAHTAGVTIEDDRLYGLLYEKALEGDKDCGGLLAFGYLSGESITKVDEGRPLFVRTPESKFNLANLMRVHLYSALGALNLGMRILLKEEQVKLDSLLGHGGLFKTKGVGQKIMAAAMKTPVSVMETAGEGGPWGMALLASYMVHREEGEKLEEYLAHKVFAQNKGSKMEPDAEDVKGFEKFMERYQAGLDIEKAAGSSL